MIKPTRFSGICSTHYRLPLTHGFLGVMVSASLAEVLQYVSKVEILVPVLVIAAALAISYMLWFVDVFVFVCI